MTITDLVATLAPPVTTLKLAPKSLWPILVTPSDIRGPVSGVAARCPLALRYVPGAYVGVWIYVPAGEEYPAVFAQQLRDQERLALIGPLQARQLGQAAERAADPPLLVTATAGQDAVIDTAGGVMHISRCTDEALLFNLPGSRYAGTAWPAGSGGLALGWGPALTWAALEKHFNGLMPEGTVYPGAWGIQDVYLRFTLDQIRAITGYEHYQRLGGRDAR